MKTIITTLTFAAALLCSCSNTQQPTNPTQQTIDAVKAARDVFCGDMPLIACIAQARALLDQMERLVDAGAR